MQADAGLLVFPAIPVQKVGDEERQVFAAVPERRQLDFNGVDAVEQVLAEFVPGGQFVDGRIGGAYEPDINRGRACWCPDEKRCVFRVR